MELKCKKEKKERKKKKKRNDREKRKREKHRKIFFTEIFIFCFQKRLAPLTDPDIDKEFGVQGAHGFSAVDKIKKKDIEFVHWKHQTKMVKPKFKFKFKVKKNKKNKK